MATSNNDIREMEKARLAREKEMVDELEYNENLNKLVLIKNRPLIIKAALALADLILIFVVIYGYNNYVYAGFPSFVPWMVGAIFAVMFIIRTVSIIRMIREGGDQPADNADDEQK